MKKKKFLDSIDVKSPCDESWDEMFGNNEVRFCSHCAKNVHNLSAMTRQKAEDLVKKSEGKLCVRYVKTPEGKLITSSPTLTKITRRAAIAASVLATSLTLSTMAYSQDSPIPKEDKIAQTKKDKDKKDAVKEGLATISGTVTDEHGAVIPNAKLTLKNLRTKKSFLTNSNAEGNYEFSNIEVSNYELKVEMSGFKTLKIKNFQITDKEKNVKDIILKPSGLVTMGIFVINLPTQSENKDSKNS